MAELTVTDRRIFSEMMNGKYDDVMQFRWGIVAFIIGCERGSYGSSGMTAVISDHIRKKYTISAEGSETWEDQLEKLAKANDSTWEDTFTRVVKEIL